METAPVAKTPVLLVFGRHWTETMGARQTSDRRFFRKSISPFIDRCMEEGRRAVVIHECCVIVDKPRAESEEEKRRIVKESVSFHQQRTQNVLSRTLDRGLPLPASGADGLDWRYYFDWGFLQQILRINSATPGRVANVVEELSPETTYISWKHEGMARDAVEEAKRSILESIELCALRDRLLLGMIERLRTEDPSRAIIIPRGYAHRGMVRLLDSDRYDTHAIAGGDCVPRFSSEAIIASYERDLSEHELERYARLSVRFSEYMEKNWDAPQYREMRQKGQTDKSIRLLKRAAREYALRMTEEEERTELAPVQPEKPSTIILIGN